MQFQRWANEEELNRAEILAELHDADTHRKFLGGLILGVLVGAFFASVIWQSYVNSLPKPTPATTVVTSQK